MSRPRQYRAGTPQGPVDDGPTIRVVAYVPLRVLQQFDEVARQQGVSRSAAIVDAMGWWHIRKRQWAIRSSRVRRTPEQEQADRESRDMATWRRLIEDAQER